MYVCVTELCGKDGVCESDVCVCEGGSSADFLFCSSAPMSSARHTALLRSANWLNEVCQDLLWRIPDPHDAAWKHQSMSLTPATTQKETFIAVVTKRKTPPNMKGLQAPHRHAASPRTCFCWPAVQNETFIAVVRKSKMPQNMKGVQAMHWHTALLRTSTWRNEVWQDLLCCIADPHDAAWEHQSMSLTPATTQKETFYCCSYKT